MKEWKEKNIWSLCELKQTKKTRVGREMKSVITDYTHGLLGNLASQKSAIGVELQKLSDMSGRISVENIKETYQIGKGFVLRVIGKTALIVGNTLHGIRGLKFKQIQAEHILNQGNGLVKKLNLRKDLFLGINILKIKNVLSAKNNFTQEWLKQYIVALNVIGNHYEVKL